MMDAPAVKCLLALIGCTALYGCSRLLARRWPAKKEAIRTGTLWAVFSVYLFLLLSFTLFDSYFSRKGFSALLSASWTDYVNRLKHNTNFIPLKTVWGFFRQIPSAPGAALLNLGGNLVAFMPFAFFLPRLFPKLRNPLPFFLWMLGIVGAVELLQFVLMTGFADVDDLLLNVGGAMLAHALLPRLCRALEPWLARLRNRLRRALEPWCARLRRRRTRS